MNYYNENDPWAVAWLRDLEMACQIAPGRVDGRDVQDVTPEDVSAYDVCHFFAGIGGWELARQMAVWDGPIWTASLPCQPFSAAGKRQETDDHRHLWPVFRNLVEQCRPPVIAGEQVASKPGRAWLATVQTDLEALGYSTAAADLCAAGIGAPHIRQRFYWCAVRVGNPERISIRRDAGGGTGAQEGPCVRAECDDPGLPGTTDRLEHADGQRRQGPALGPPTGQGKGAGGTGRASWDDVAYVPCADGKARPIKPGTQPLVNGLPDGLVRGGDRSLAPDPTRSAEARTMRLKGYGNAIVPELAAVFLQSVRESLSACRA